MTHITTKPAPDFSARLAVLKKVVSLAEAEPDSATAYEALTLFLGVLADDPDSATPELYSALVAELAPPPQVARPSAEFPPPLVFSESLLSACFRSRLLTAEVCAQLGVAPVLFRGENGAQVRGIALAAELPVAERPLLLETGELVAGVEPTSVVWLADAQDYVQLPATLLSYLFVGLEQFEKFGWVSSAALALKAAGTLGEFTVPLELKWASEDTAKMFAASVDTADAAAKIGATGATGATGFTANIPFADQQVVQIKMDVATAGPYVVGQLLSGPAGRVTVHLDRPRENSFRGFYLFPAPDADRRVQQVLVVGVI